MPRSSIYRALCEHLEVTDHVTDAVECWQQMMGELAGNTDTDGEEVNWIPGQG